MPCACNDILLKVTRFWLAGCELVCVRPTNQETSDGKAKHTMHVITTVQEMLDTRASWAASQSVGLTPTMGYLHKGHLCLVRQARAENQKLVTSIFVNPTQFGPQEDLARYPRDLQRDLSMLEDCGVDVVFTPTPAEIYPPDFASYV